MNNLSAPNQARIPIGTVVVNGQQLEVTINVEWARYFESLTVTTNSNTAAAVNGKNGADGVAVMLAGDGAESVEFVPGPPGAPGPQGAPGPALFLLQDDMSDQGMLTPPSLGNPTLASLGAAALAGSSTQAFATAALSVNGAGGAAVPLAISASTGANGMQIKGRADHFGFIEFFKNDGVTLEGSIYGAPGKIVLTGPSGADALVITTAGVAAVGAFGANGKAPQGAAASGGTLAGVIAALVANGILSS
jgi:hypothetical protein